MKNGEELAGSFKEKNEKNRLFKLSLTCRGRQNIGSIRSHILTLISSHQIVLSFFAVRIAGIVAHIGAPTARFAAAEAFALQKVLVRITGERMKTAARHK